MREFITKHPIITFLIVDEVVTAISNTVMYCAYIHGFKKNPDVEHYKKCESVGLHTVKKVKDGLESYKKPEEKEEEPDVLEGSVIEI